MSGVYYNRNIIMKTIKCPNCDTDITTENKIQVNCNKCNYLINLKEVNENKDKKINLNEVVPKNK